MIYKYYLNAYEPTTLKIPELYQILAIQLQGSSICVWIDIDYWVDGESTFLLKDPESLKILTFYPVMTGDSPEEGMLYIATIQTIAGLVVHYYV